MGSEEYLFFNQLQNKTKEKQTTDYLINHEKLLLDYLIRNIINNDSPKVSLSVCVYPKCRELFLFTHMYFGSELE